MSLVRPRRTDRTRPDSTHRTTARPSNPVSPNAVLGASPTTPTATLPLHVGLSSQGGQIIDSYIEPLGANTSYKTSHACASPLYQGDRTPGAIADARICERDLSQPERVAL
jgi:hypothetical protein